MSAPFWSDSYKYILQICKTKRTIVRVKQNQAFKNAIKGCPLGAVGIFNGHFFIYFIGVPHGCQIDLVELFLEVTKE